MTQGMVSKLQWPAWPAISATARLFHRLVGQHRAAHHVAHRPHAGQVGLAVAVDLDEATLVDLEADRFGVEAGGVGHATDGDDQAVELGLLGAILGFVLDGDGLLADGDLADLDGQLDVEALLGTA
jgi:hypothetical protein